MSHPVHMARWATRLRTGRALLVLLSTLGACNAERSTSPNLPSPDEQTTDELRAAPTAASASADAACLTSGYLRLVNVSTASQLASALSNARPGDLIKMADGTYNGRFRPRAQGTQANRITMCGSPQAILNDNGGGYALGPEGARWWVFRGFTIRNGLKGIMADRSHDNLFDTLVVHSIGGECVHFRNGSSRNTIQRSYIHHCGVRDKNGEGVYIGSAPGNVSNDTANDNRVLDNRIEDTSAEAIEAKENTRRAVIRGNVAKRSGRQQCALDGGDCASAGASAVIAGRPSDATIECNAVTRASGISNAVQVYSGGGGDNNVILWNKEGPVSIARSQTGNQATQNTQAGYEAHCQ